MSAAPMRFWFVHARHGRTQVCLAVAASTERSARMQARKQVGPSVLITDVSLVPYPHAWVLNLVWRRPDGR